MGTKRDVTGTLSGRSQHGGLSDIGVRIAEARERLGITKAELARRIGKPTKAGWRLIHKWEEEGQNPDSESLAMLARGLEVTTDELMGIAAGQDPPFASWHAFVAELAAEGDALTEDEGRGLKSIFWGVGREPTVRGYWSALTMLRNGTRDRGRD